MGLGVWDGVESDLQTRYYRLGPPPRELQHRAYSGKAHRGPR